MLFFPEKYKIFYLRNKIPLSLPPLNFAFSLFCQIPSHLMHKATWMCVEEENLKHGT